VASEVGTSTSALDAFLLGGSRPEEVDMLFGLPISNRDLSDAHAWIAFCRQSFEEDEDVVGKDWPQFGGVNVSVFDDRVLSDLCRRFNDYPSLGSLFSFLFSVNKFLSNDRAYVVVLERIALFMSRLSFPRAVTFLKKLKQTIQLRREKHPIFHSIKCSETLWFSVADLTRWLGFYNWSDVSIPYEEWTADRSRRTPDATGDKYISAFAAAFTAFSNDSRWSPRAEATPYDEFFANWTLFGTSGGARAAKRHANNARFTKWEWLLQQTDLEGLWRMTMIKQSRYEVRVFVKTDEPGPKVRFIASPDQNLVVPQMWWLHRAVRALKGSTTVKLFMTPKQTFEWWNRVQDRFPHSYMWPADQSGFDVHQSLDDIIFLIRAVGRLIDSHPDDSANTDAVVHALANSWIDGRRITSSVVSGWPITAFIDGLLEWCEMYMFIEQGRCALHNDKTNSVVQSHGDDYFLLRWNVSADAFVKSVASGLVQAKELGFELNPAKCTASVPLANTRIDVPCPMASWLKIMLVSPRRPVDGRTVVGSGLVRSVAPWLRAPGFATGGLLAELRQALATVWAVFTRQVVSERQTNRFYSVYPEVRRRFEIYAGWIRESRARSIPWAEFHAWLYTPVNLGGMGLHGTTSDFVTITTTYDVLKDERLDPIDSGSIVFSAYAALGMGELSNRAAAVWAAATRSTKKGLSGERFSWKRVDASLPLATIHWMSRLAASKSRKLHPHFSLPAWAMSMEQARMVGSTPAEREEVLSSHLDGASRATYEVLQAKASRGIRLHWLEGKLSSGAPQGMTVSPEIVAHLWTSVVEGLFAEAISTQRSISTQSWFHHLAAAERGFPAFLDNLNLFVSV